MNCENCYAAVVIYNKLCDDAITCKNLGEIGSKYNVKIIIADNSTDEAIKFKNRTHCKEHNWKYIDMGGNKGLSVAYNKIIDDLPRFSDKDCIIWFDDDTKITQEYFSELFRCFNTYTTSDVFVPIIKGENNKIYSPNERGFFKNHLIKNVKATINQKRFNAINSCMAVRTSYYDNYRYDETLFMDMVDQKFCFDATNKGVVFTIINVEIIQNFFQRSKELNVDNVWKRYQIRIKDFMNYANFDVLHRWLGVIKVSLWGLDMALRCKSCRIFFKCFIKGISSAWKLSIGKTLG